eukprot:gene39160-51553_t
MAPPSLAAEDEKDVEITVLAASELAKVDTFGKTDAYCIVTWHDSVLGKTVTVRKTLDPVWEDQTFTLRVPIEQHTFLLMEQNGNATSLSIEVWH